MASFQRTPPYGGAFARRFTRYSGLYFDEFAADSAWIREDAVVRLPPMSGIESLKISGEAITHPQANGIGEQGYPVLEVLADGHSAFILPFKTPGPWVMEVKLDPAKSKTGSVLYFRLHGVAFTNALAWLGRVTKISFLQRYRAQNKNRQIRICAIESGSGEKVYDFSKREGPYCVAFARAHARTGMNIVGFLTADLGIGESARCMVRAADAASIPTALVNLKLNCRNRLGDATFSDRIQESNPYGVNVVHLDPPAARDIDHHHGAGFRAAKYNIGYFAWELQEYPDSWMPAFDYFDEIWCPSDFVRESISPKAPFPVLTMPHSISFARPSEDRAALRARLGLPAEPFLFLCLFDLNSYTARKNPRAVVEAFRQSGLAGGSSALVIKVQNADANVPDYDALVDSVRDIPGTVVIRHTLSRADVYALESACDCYVSLHRSEGFGLAVAECMYLGKPVISTNWSATSEYLNSENGLPVRYSLVQLEENHGPYPKGATWAEPDVGHAAQLMSTIASAPHESARIGAAARLTIEERFSPAAIGARYRRRLEAIASL
jgi:glycosyltransferase involved in cell wall biosynthesis